MQGLKLDSNKVQDHPPPPARVSKISVCLSFSSEQGCVVRLGGLRWAPELLRVGHTAGGDRSDLRQERDTDLCHGLADILEVYYDVHILQTFLR